MPKVRFQATPETPEWQHTTGGKGTVVKARHGDGTTTKIRGDGVLKDGDTVEMTQSEVSWCLTIHPDNFTLVEDTTPIQPDDHTRDELDEMAQAKDPDYNPDDYSTKQDVCDFLNEEEH